MDNIIEAYKNLSLIDMDGEIWKAIDGFEDFYAVSNFGRIKTFARKIIKDYHGNNQYPTKIMTQCKRNTNHKLGYLKVDLSINTNIKQKSVHRLVATTFIPNPQNKPCVNHKNRDGRDNRVENLEWCTHKENSKHWIKSEGRTVIQVAFKFNDSQFKFPEIRNKWKETTDKLISSDNVVLSDLMWHEVVGFEGYYIVSEYGHVISLDRIVNRLNQYGAPTMRVPSRLVRQNINKINERFQVHINKNSKDKYTYPHILVAKAFIHNPNSYPYVNHKDADAFNNHYSNLEWCTHSHNQKHLYKFNRRERMIGVRHVLSKKVRMVNLESKTDKIYDCIGDIYREHGISRSSISNACNGKRGLINGFKFSFV